MTNEEIQTLVEEMEDDSKAIEPVKKIKLL
jgi:hypothetical protein